MFVVLVGEKSAFGRDVIRAHGRRVDGEVVPLAAEPVVVRCDVVHALNTEHLTLSRGAI